MGLVVAAFGRDAERVADGFGGDGEFGEAGGAVDTGVEDAGLMGVGKPADALDGDVERTGAGRRLRELL